MRALPILGFVAACIYMIWRGFREKRKYRLAEPPAIGFYPESGRCVWDQKALDAYVQEKVQAERKMWQSRESEEYRQALLKRAVEAEKRAEKAESNMAKAVLAESEWWHPHAPMHHLDYMKEFGKECPCIKCRRLAVNRNKVKP